MKLNLYIIDRILGILSGVKISKIADKEAKDALLKDYIAMRKHLKAASEDKDEIIRKFQEDWQDTLAPVDVLRKEGKPVVGYDDFLEAEKDANRAIQDTFGKEVELTLAPVPFDAIEDVSEDITLEQVAFLQDNGIIKEE